METIYNGLTWATAATAIGLIAISLLAPPAQAEPSTSRSFYDRNGSFAGSSNTHGNSTSFSDRNGRFDGTTIRNSNGTSSFYDRNGHFTGSSSNTGPQR